MNRHNFDTLIEWEKCTKQDRQQLLTRPVVSASDRITRSVNEIHDRVKAEGYSALRALIAEFDKVNVESISVTP